MKIMKNDQEPWKPTWNHDNWPGTMKNQPEIMKNNENQPGTMKNHENLTQNEKVLIFRHTCGVTTDLLDV